MKKSETVDSVARELLALWDKPRGNTSAEQFANVAAAFERLRNAINKPAKPSGSRSGYSIEAPGNCTRDFLIGMEQMDDGYDGH